MDNRGHRRALAAVWLASAVFLLFFVNRGWIRGDEGLLGQTAERVLAGELPHRDFDDMYTGGLAVAHAASFRVLGIRLTSIRWLLYLATLLFVPLAYRISARFAPAWVAGAATIACVVWTVPAYFASMPSWYNLFLAAATLLALFRWIESEHRRWLFVAGACAGTSFLFKSAALLLIAGVLLFFVFREQEAEAARQDRDGVARPQRLGFSMFTTVGLAAFVAALISFVSQKPDAMALILFVLPGTLLATYLAVRAWQLRTSAFQHRLKTLLAPVLPFSAGLAAPLALFVGWYAAQGGLSALLDDRFFFESKRLVFTTFPLPAKQTVLFVLPFAALLAWPMVLGARPRWERRLLAPAALIATLVAAYGAHGVVYQSVWFTLRPMVPTLAIVGVGLLISRRVTLDRVRRQQLFLLTATVAVISVMQFPYSWGLYFCYFAPLVIWTIVAVVYSTPAAPRRLHACQLALYIGFGLLWVDFANAETHGWYFEPRQQDTLLATDRAGLRVPETHADVYQRLIAAVREQVPPDEPIFATPDCPEVYFLTGRRNPTATLGDYFDDDFGTPARDQRLLAMLDAEGIRLVVLHWLPNFSGKPESLVPEIEARFPNRLSLPPFSIHWRETVESTTSSASPSPSDASIQ